MFQSCEEGAIDSLGVYVSFSRTQYGAPSGIELLNSPFGVRWSTTTGHCVLQVDGQLLFYLSLCVRKPTIWVSTRSDTNQPVQSQKQARSSKFQI